MHVWHGAAPKLHTDDCQLLVRFQCVCNQIFDKVFCVTFVNARPFTKSIFSTSLNMHAVTRAGREPKARINPSGLGLILVSGAGSALAQEGVVSEKKTAVEQLEQLLREQQGLQMRQTQQLQSIRQQLDEQERANAAQDWQWVGGLALMLLLGMVGVWLLQQGSARWAGQWVNPWASWKQARLARREQRQARREQAATERMLRQRETPEASANISSDHLRTADEAADEIDHSGPGALENLLRKTRIKRALKRERRQARHAPPDDLPAGQGWLAVLDEPDSQLLADEAVREFELRRAVGLQAEPELPPASAKAAQRQHTIDTESAWQAMQEISLAEPLQAEAAESGPAPAGASVRMSTGVGVGVGATVEAGVDVSLEVQRVRSGLRMKREQRHLTVLPAAEPIDTGSSFPQTLRTGMECDIPVDDPEETSAPAPHQSMAAAAPVLAHAPDAAVALDASGTEPRVSPPTAGSAAPAASAHSFSISSLPAHTEAETRLALGYEFQKLGQHDEAAQLYEEVLAMGAGIDQTRARQLLSALPGR